MSDNEPDTELSAEQALKAVEQHFWLVWSNFGRGPGCQLHEEDGMVWYDTPIPILPYQALIRFDGADNIDGRIDRIIAHYKRRNVPFMWIVHPTSPPGLADRLEARGLQEAEVIPGMVMRLSQLPEPGPAPDGFEVREAKTREDLDRFMELIAWRWEVPPEVKGQLPVVTSPFKLGEPGSRTHVWGAYKDGDMVSKVVSYYGDDGVVGVYGVATRNEVRGLGLARILTVMALKSAYENHYPIGVLHSSPMAKSLYRKIGFKPVDDLIIYATTEMHV